MTYEQAREDCEYLFSAHGPSCDTDASIMNECGLLDILIEYASTDAAKEYCRDQIDYWFRVGPVEVSRRTEWCTDIRVEDIAHRHGLASQLEDLVDYYCPCQPKDK